MNRSWESHFHRQLEQARAAHKLRKRGGNSCHHSGVLDFGTNDYLGLAQHPEVARALYAGEAECGQRFGSGASPVLSGYTPDHRQLEDRLSEIIGCEASLVFSSGYACNFGVISTLVGKSDLVLSDALNHACLIDGIRLSGAQKFIYPHLDLAAAREILEQQRSRYQRAILVTESVFSMDGDLADLSALANLCDEFDCGLVVDEAHALGVFGESGGGLARELQVERRLLAKLGTLSKAAGSIGGYAGGSAACIEFLVNHCRSYIFSTAPPAPVMQASHAALSLLSRMDREREQLRHQSSELRRTLQQLGWSVPEGESPILPVVVGSEQNALSLSQKLLNNGISVPAIRPPTVPEGSCRLRISLSALHTDEDLLRLAEVLGPCHNTGSEVII